MAGMTQEQVATALTEIAFYRDGLSSLDEKVLHEAVRLLSHQNDGVWVSKEDLPPPDRLELLAAWIDAMYPNDSNPEVQSDLRRWATNIRKALND